MQAGDSRDFPLSPALEIREWSCHTCIMDEQIKPLPREFYDRDAERVAREGFAGFMAGHRLVVPGTPNRIMTLLPRLFPHRLIVDVAERWWNHGRRSG